MKRPLWQHRILWFVVAVALIPMVVPVMGSTVRLATEILVMILFALAFNFLLGFTGQLSFGHAAYYGLGAYAAALIQVKLWPSTLGPVLLSPLLGLMAAAAVGVLIIRKRGIYFSLLTLAFAQLFYFIVFEWSSFTGGEYGLGGIVRHPVFGISIQGDYAFYVFVAILVIPSVILLCRIVDSPFGRVLQAIRENERRAGCLGYNTRLYKFLSFVISGAFAGLAGGLSSLIFCYVSVDYLHWSTSGFVVMMALIGGLSMFFGPAVGAFIFVLAKDLLSSLTEQWMIPFGIIFVLFVLFAPQGIGGLVHSLWIRFRRPMRSDIETSRQERTHALSEGSFSLLKSDLGTPYVPSIPEQKIVLSAEGLVKRFGGLAAVAGVSLDVRTGEIHSVIGPNGAGKTTLFNLLTGILMPNEGRIVLQGRDVTHEANHRRIHQGLARSFQITSIFKNLTTLENVRIAIQSLSGVRLNVFSRADSHMELRTEAMKILKEVGLAGRENEIAGTLGYGEQRLLEIAIALATRPVVLLLDEPLAGLPDSERGRIAQFIKALAQRYAVLLIEHDIDRVIEISDRITVMHEGQVIAKGSPAEIQENTVVQEAYIGHTATPEEVWPPGATKISERAPFLVADKINTFYGFSHILHNISFSIGETEMACLLGRNGAGKSTTLKSLMGIAQVRQGRITLAGQEIQTRSPHRIAQLGIAIVPEGARIFPNLTVVEHLLMASRCGRSGSWDFSRVYDLLPRLRDLRDRRGEQLSGGERKMLAIGRALLANPKLLLLDEPLEGLAPALVHNILQVLRMMQGEMAILIVEQKASMILPLCESAFILNNGMMAYSGKSVDLLADEVRLQQLLGV